MTDTTRCGYVAIIGRPNVGKSTLLNAILGKKISITSDKPQTTRSQILGIKTTDHAQAIYIDTPGMHSENKAANRYMNRLASGVIGDADIILFMIDATRWLDGDEVIFSKIKHAECPVILVLNKVDKLKDKSVLLPLLEKLQAKFSFTQIVPISALETKNVLALEKDILTLLPIGNYLFPKDQITDKSGEFQAAELIREKIMRAT
jgi:GTP-binding protein Era